MFSTDFTIFAVNLVNTTWFHIFYWNLWFGLTPDPSKPSIFLRNINLFSIVAEKIRILANCAQFHANVTFYTGGGGISRIPGFLRFGKICRISGRNQPQKMYGIPLVFKGLGGLAEDHSHRHALFAFFMEFAKNPIIYLKTMKSTKFDWFLLVSQKIMDPAWIC